MIKIVENCTLLAKYECLNDSHENIRLQERLYPGEDINQGTEVIQILLDEKFENGCFSPKSLTYEIGKLFKQVLKHDGKYTYFSVRLWTLEGWNNNRIKEYQEVMFDKEVDFDFSEQIPTNIFYFKPNTEGFLTLCRNGKEVQVEDLVDELLSASENWGCLELQRKDIFSLCQFEKCLTKLQKETIVDGLMSSGNKVCLDKSKLVEQREFMFITHNLLKSLICQERYEQAQKLLDDVTLKCSGICKTQTVGNSCGCI